MTQLQSLLSSPFSAITLALICGVIFVNGWTDAPNAISSCIATRSLSPRKAVLMSAIFNLFGVLIVSRINASVADSIRELVSFDGQQKISTIALCAAMSSIIIWSTLTWAFGIPTSESHALTAGLSGAAVALKNSFGGINLIKLGETLYGLLFSSFLGFFLGFITAKAIGFIFRKADRQKANSLFKNAQIISGAAMSFMHGAQDGQKFLGVLLIGTAISSNTPAASNDPHIILVMLVSVIMALGTSLGGSRIIKSVGIDMVKLEKHRGFAADLSSVLCLLFPTLLGIPVSTTHTKTSAVMGVGVAKRMSALDLSKVKEICLAWLLTFPFCGLTGYITAKIFFFIFC